MSCLVVCDVTFGSLNTEIEEDPEPWRKKKKIFLPDLKGVSTISLFWQQSLGIKNSTNLWNWKNKSLIQAVSKIFCE